MSQLANEVFLMPDIVVVGGGWLVGDGARRSLLGGS